MQYLWGMIRAMQMIVMMSLVLVVLPSYAQMFFAGAILFANMDVLSGEDFYENNFNFKETEALNERFETMGMDSQNFIKNSGSYFILMILIYGQFFFKRLINKFCIYFAKYKIVRLIALKVHPEKEEPIEMFKATIKLF